MKSVLITGCSSGFGRGMVDEFLGRGWHVFSTVRNAQQRRDILAEPRKQYGEQLTILDLELTDKSQREAVVEAVQQKGQLDCLVNNAGDRVFGALEDLSEAQIRYQFEVNFYAPVLLTRALLPLLREAKGSVIFVSSMFGYLGFPLTSAYCASKYALEGFAESLYYELEPHGVRVALIEPGASKTNFGKNVVWGALSSEAYRLQTENYHQLKAKLSLRARNNTPVVARRVADIAEGRDRSFRVRVGRDATLAYLFQRLLPERISVPLSKMLFRRLFLRRTHESTI